MSMAARIHFEDLVVARGRLKRLKGPRAEKRTMGPGQPVPILVAHRERVDELVALLREAGGEEALTADEHALAVKTARRRLAADREAGRCLCALRLCAQSPSVVH